MLISRLFAVVVLAVSMSATAAAAEPCSLGTKYHVSSVVPYRANENLGLIYETKLRGAEIRVEAAPGLTQEWLQSRVQTQIANGECDFGDSSVKVHVVSMGDQFSVQLAGRGDRDAQNILSHAQRLAPVESAQPGR
jgi:hypothetical protein